jgi:hypothetical protein
MKKETIPTPDLDAFLAALHERGGRVLVVVPLELEHSTVTTLRVTEVRVYYEEGMGLNV